MGRYLWNYIVFDEAHRVKNELSLVGQAKSCSRAHTRARVTHAHARTHARTHTDVPRGPGEVTSV